MRKKTHTHVILLWLALLMVPCGVQAQPARSAAAEARLQNFAHFANQLVEQLGGYQKKGVAITTGTNRGGTIIGYYDGTALKALAVTLGLSGRDDVTRFLFRNGRVGAIDVFTVPYDPQKRTLLQEKRKLKARYLLVSTGTRYVLTGSSTTYRPITEAERSLIDDIMTNLPRYRALLAGRRYQ